jgi:hypothetical protein
MSLVCITVGHWMVTWVIKVDQFGVITNPWSV